MSEERVELVRRLIEAIGDREYEAAGEHLDPDAEWNNTTVFPGPRTVVGADAIVEFWRDLFESYRGGGSGMEADEIVDGDDVVVVGVHGWGRGMSSGVPIDEHWAHVLTFRGAKIVRVDTHGHLDRALEATGLSE